ncbi:uncharacterized protein LY89DRAFT_756790 [Mollisia scopiformis]|uniref:Uncharacterized protein n=1 Tax=Mollisia scopiformis TaxID=149040 RepID=A0A194WWL7_MOLSC|nr:uncharacterized protein LY89DRAFT_756790 [Mollisia scopiformis]KUJ12371.1 hypothetical protein LY89DRAFT_756790 [Mollisia scopiformis]
MLIESSTSMKYTTTLLVVLILITTSICRPSLPSTSSLELALEPNTTVETRQTGRWQTWPSVNYEPSFGPPYCYKNNPEKANQCILTNRMPEGNPDWTEFYLYDHNCVPIGGNDNVPYRWLHYNFDSELPWVMGFKEVLGGYNMGWGFSNRWYDVQHFDQAPYCYNTGGSKELLPACQMYWGCSH